MGARTEVLIIGGGIAGLACARALHDGGIRFRLLTEDVGGRLKFSGDGAVSYGAYFVGSDYEHVLPFVEKRHRLWPHRAGFNQGERKFSVFRTGRYPGQAFRLLRDIVRFRRHFKHFRRRCLSVDQRTAILEDAYLRSLYTQRADAFIAERGYVELVKEVWEQPAYAVAFSVIERLSAFDFLHLMRYLLTVPVFTFRPLDDELSAGFTEHVLVETVTSVRRGAEGYEVDTASGERWTADRVVVATPPTVTRRLLNLPEMKTPVVAFTTHVRGQWMERTAGHDEEFFPAGEDVITVARQEDDSAVVVSTVADFDLSRVFSSWTKEHQLKWDPAFNLGPGPLWPAEVSPGLFIAGDHNVCCLEDAALTGLYAANRILGLVPPSDAE